MNKPKARLENWYVGYDDCLYGNVYGHERLPDGEMVRTSRVVTFDAETKKAETKNTHYQLGEPMNLKKETEQ